jgi:hypothetical protein
MLQRPRTLAEQLQPWPTRAPRGEEPGGGGAEHELQQLPALAAHLQAPTVVADGQHNRPFEATAEVGDPGRRTDAGDLS